MFGSKPTAVWVGNFVELLDSFFYFVHAGIM